MINTIPCVPWYVKDAHLMFFTEYFGVKLNFLARQGKVKLYYFYLIFLVVLEQFPLGKPLKMSSLLVTFLFQVPGTETCLGLSSPVVSTFFLIR